MVSLTGKTIPSRMDMVIAMQMPDPVTPFRWNIARREQIGRLCEGVNVAQAYAGFTGHLREAAVRVVAASQDGRLVFVGRSPEYIYDYLSGLFRDLEEDRELTLLQFSAPREQVSSFAGSEPGKLAHLFSYLDTERLAPADIAAADRSVRFVDLVASGRTFAQLLAFLEHHAGQSETDWKAVKRRLGLIGLTWRTKNSPNTRRWWQRPPWTDEHAGLDIRSVSVHTGFWDFCGNNPQKVTPSHYAGRWSSLDDKGPPREEHHLAALALACSLYDRGCEPDERARFAAALARRPEFREAWLRSLVLRLKGR